MQRRREGRGGWTGPEGKTFFLRSTVRRGEKEVAFQTAGPPDAALPAGPLHLFIVRFLAHLIVFPWIDPCNVVKSEGHSAVSTEKGKPLCSTIRFRFIGYTSRNVGTRHGTNAKKGQRTTFGNWRLMKVLAVVNSLASRAHQVNNASRESYRTLLVSTCRRTRTRDYGTGTHSSSSSSAVWARQCQWVMPHAHSHLGTALSSTERADVCISLFSQKGDLGGERGGNERTNKRRHKYPP